MPFLLRLIDPIDRLNLALAGLLRWGVLAAVLLSAANALLRKTLDLGSNALLEGQWYLFAAVFLLGAGPVLLRNGHVRIDVLAQRFGLRVQAAIDAIGLLLVVLPLCLLLIDLSWPLFAEAWRSGEASANAGGLPRWPAWALLPLGFGLLALQAVAEVLRRLAFLARALPSPYAAVATPPADPAALPAAASRP